MTALKAMLATAEEEGLIRSNPARAVRLPTRSASARAKHLEPEELEALFAEVPEEWTLFVRLVAYTGARIGEFTELRWKDLDLTTDPAVLSISRRRYRGLVDSPKSSHGVRRLPLTPALKRELAAHRLQSAWSKDDDPIFATRFEGNPYRGEDLLRRVIKPAAMAAGLVDAEGKTWPGWHTLRHYLRHEPRPRRSPPRGDRRLARAPRRQFLPRHVRRPTLRDEDRRSRPARRVGGVARSHISPGIPTISLSRHSPGCRVGSVA